MSLIQLPAREAPARADKVTAQTLLAKKQTHQPITALTAYDYPTARLVDQAGIDLLLVGDSLGMAVLGYDNTLPVTLDEMLHHTRAVRRAVQRALLVADMPFGSYTSEVQAVATPSASSRRPVPKPSRSKAAATAPPWSPRSRRPR